MKSGQAVRKRLAWMLSRSRIVADLLPFSRCVVKVRAVLQGSRCTLWHLHPFRAFSGFLSTSLSLHRTRFDLYSFTQYYQTDFWPGNHLWTRSDIKHSPKLFLAAICHHAQPWTNEQAVISPMSLATSSCGAELITLVPFEMSSTALSGCSLLVKKEVNI